MSKKKPKASRKKLVQAQTNLALEQLRAFEGAKQSRRTEHWLAQMRGPNADLRPALKWLIARHQDLADSDPWVRRAIDVIVTNTIGTGIEGAPVRASRRFSDDFNDWAKSTSCDFYGQMNLWGLSELVLRTAVTRGSALVRKRLDPSLARRGLIPLQLQVMEPDYLDTGRDNGTTIYGGKEYDTDGRWVGAYLFDYHPGEGTILRRQSTFVPRSELLHVYEIRRAQQYTGIPWGAAIILRARDIGDYESATILKNKLAACFAGFVVTPDPESDKKGDVLTETIEPGLLQRLAGGEDIRFPNPPKVDGYGEFMGWQLRGLAMNYGITYESLTGDFSGSNFSSGRMGWLEQQRNVTRWQWNMLIPQFCSPVGDWYLDLAQVTSRARIARTFEWTPPRREMVNPKEEIAYLVDAVRAGFMSLSYVQRTFGFIPRDLLDELAEDLDEARCRGLALSVDGTQDTGRLQAEAFSNQGRESGESSDDDDGEGDDDTQAGLGAQEQ